MISVKKVLILFTFGFLLLSLIGCGHKNIGSSFTNLTTNNIEKIEVSSPKNQWSESLTGEEVVSLVKLLNNINENEIKEYNGPTIKGGPTSIIIFIKSNKTLNLTLNGDSFIFGEGNKDYQVNEPNISEYINQVHTKNK